MLYSVNLILLQSNEVDTDGRAVLTDGRARHIRSVLKASVGQSLRIGLLDGPFGQGCVVSVDDRQVELQCRFEEQVPPKPTVDLLLAMPRPKVMKRLWPQLAALGVGRIVLLRAEKVERYYFDSHVVEPDFYRERLIEGLQQARCTRMPEVLVRPRLKPFVEDELEALFAGQQLLLADPSGTRRLSDCPAGPNERTVLAIGPEGGWTPYELEQLEQRGFQRFGLGSRILRTDTAVVGLLSMLSNRETE